MSTIDRSRSRRAVAAATACWALLSADGLAGCGDDGDSDEAAAPAPAGNPSGNTYDATGDPPDATIEIAPKDMAFVPQYVTALPGQTLEWTNEDDVPFDSPQYGRPDQHRRPVNARSKARGMYTAGRMEYSPRRNAGPS